MFGSRPTSFNQAVPPRPSPSRCPFAEAAGLPSPLKAHLLSHLGDMLNIWPPSSQHTSRLTTPLQGAQLTAANLARQRSNPRFACGAGPRAAGTKENRWCDSRLRLVDLAFPTGRDGGDSGRWILCMSKALSCVDRRLAPLAAFSGAIKGFFFTVTGVSGPPPGSSMYRNPSVTHLGLLSMQTSILQPLDCSSHIHIAISTKGTRVCQKRSRGSVIVEIPCHRCYSLRYHGMLAGILVLC